MVAAKQPTGLGGKQRDAAQDYLESDSETSRIRIRADPTVRGGTILRLEVEIYPHLRNRPRCSGCGRRGPQYDTLPTRWFEFVRLWGLRVFFLNRMRRVACAPCGGVRVERVPWAEGNTS